MAFNIVAWYPHISDIHDDARPDLRFLGTMLMGSSVRCVAHRYVPISLPFVYIDPAIFSSISGCGHVKNIPAFNIDIKSS
jgi:hypothetical protein